MMSPIDVSPIEIRDYALSCGWTLIKEALKDGLFLLNSPDNNYRQIMLPMESDRIDFNSLAELSIDRLAEQTKNTNHNILGEIREVNDDVVSLRYFSDSRAVNSLSFQETLASIEATKQLILAAGSSVINPVLYHKRLTRTEAVELLKKTRFRHTEQGSFILKISCPIQLDNFPKRDHKDDQNLSKPISRKAFELINLAAYKLLNTIKEDSFDELLTEQKQTEKPIISYNFCDSLVNLFDDEKELPLELKFQWSRAYLHKLPPLQIPSVITFPYSFKSKLDDLKNYFKPENTEMEDTFFGTVESLNGDEDNNGRRSGEVILALIIEGEIVNTRTILEADNYDTAYKSHGQGGGLIKVKGKLLSGKRIRSLEEVTTFERVLK